MGTERSEELWSAVLGIFSVVRGLVGGLGLEEWGVVGQNQASIVSLGAHHSDSALVWRLFRTVQAQCAPLSPRPRIRGVQRVHLEPLNTALLCSCEHDSDRGTRFCPTQIGSLCYAHGALTLYESTGWFASQPRHELV